MTRANGDSPLPSLHGHYPASSLQRNSLAAGTPLAGQGCERHSVAKVGQAFDQAFGLLALGSVLKVIRAEVLTRQDSRHGAVQRRRSWLLPPPSSPPRLDVYGAERFSSMLHIKAHRIDRAVSALAGLRDRAVPRCVAHRELVRPQVAHDAATETQCLRTR